MPLVSASKGIPPISSIPPHLTERRGRFGRLLTARNISCLTGYATLSMIHPEHYQFSQNSHSIVTLATVQSAYSISNLQLFHLVERAAGRFERDHNTFTPCTHIPTRFLVSPMHHHFSSISWLSFTSPFPFVSKSKKSRAPTPDRRTGSTS